MHVHRFASGSYIVAEHLELGDDVQIGAGVEIRATTCRLEDGVSIGDGCRVLAADALHLGHRTRWGARNEVVGRSIEVGAYGYWESGIEVGQGGRYGPRSTLRVGPYGMVCDRVLINLSDAVEIGAWVGIGNEVNIWTHGSFLPILEGFPAAFGPVSIGERVWLPARSVVLPGCTIGDHVVIGMGSLVNRDVPSGAFAAGWPVRILAEDRYPRDAPERSAAQVRAILEDYRELATFKGLDVEVAFDEAAWAIRCNDVAFDLRAMQARGRLGAAEEDFRDFLRRRGIKFFTGEAFRSVLPPAFARLLAVEVDA